eukprot:2371788-Karenia_brevis.AAC.1
MHENFLSSVKFRRDNALAKKAEPETQSDPMEWWDVMYRTKRLSQWCEVLNRCDVPSDVTDTITSKDEVWEALSHILNTDFTLKDK